MADQKLLADVLKRVDRNELAQLTKELVDIPSPTGAERAIGERQVVHSPAVYRRQHPAQDASGPEPPKGRAERRTS